MVNHLNLNNDKDFGFLLIKSIKNGSITSYLYTADCSEEQKNKGKYFYVNLGTSYGEPEVIDNLYFYNYLDSMTEEQKKKLYRRKDEAGQEICDEYFDIPKMKIVPRYCTQKELDDEKKQQAK